MMEMPFGKGVIVHPGEFFHGSRKIGETSMCFLESKRKHFQVPCFSFSGGESNSGCFQKSVVILGKFLVKNKTDILHDHFSPTLKLQ